MYSLGISCFYHDSSIALISSNQIEYAAQEERFTRIKHDSSFPSNALAECIAIFNLDINHIASIVFYENPLIKHERRIRCNKSDFLHVNKDIYESLAIPHTIASLTGWSLDLILSKIYYSSHHYSHAASTFYCSGFSSSAVLVADAVGESETISIYKGDSSGLTKLWALHYPSSVGLFYSAFTYYCGFKVNSGEYKLMGLAPLGKPVYEKLILDNLIELCELSPPTQIPLVINSAFYTTDPSSPIVESQSLLSELLGFPPRLEGQKINQEYINLAASAQSVLNKVMLHLAKYSCQLTGESNLCMAGGVALNCSSNSFIRQHMNLKNIFVQPASGDAGGALGAALLGSNHVHDATLPSRSKQPDHIFWGSPLESEDTIRHLLDSYNLIYSTYSDPVDLATIVSNRLMQGDIIAIARGRAEFGPRSLGHRSILADPRNPHVKYKVNEAIKYRESFRPFGPIIHDYNFEKYFKADYPSNPYMLFLEEFKLPQDVLQKQNSKHLAYSSVRHVDNTARCQVIPASPLELHSLILQHCEQYYSCDMLLNTSFNVRGEPLVNTAFDALNTFFGTSLDACVIGSYFIDKRLNCSITTLPTSSWKETQWTD